MKRRGRKSAAQTPALAKERISGSSTNPSKSAASKKSGASIKFTKSILNTLSEKAKEYNEKHPNNKVSVSTLKAVMRRGMGAFSTSHRPGMTRQGWGYARVNKFLLKRGGGKVKAAYVQDDDLMARGGILDYFIHWTNRDGLENILVEGVLYEETSLTNSLSLPFDIENNMPFGIRFKNSIKSELEKVGDVVGVTELEQEFEYRTKSDVDLEQYFDGFVVRNNTNKNRLEKFLDNSNAFWNSYQFPKYYKSHNGYNILVSVNKYEDDDLMARGGMTYHLGGDMSKHLAPNGRKSNLTHEQWHLVRTPEFKAWFGDWENDPENASKVVDENGEPLMVIHKTTENFNVFDKDKIGEANKFTILDGFFFGNYKSKSEGLRNIESFLNLKNPIILNESNTFFDSVGYQEAVAHFIVNGTEDYLREYLEYEEKSNIDYILSKWEKADGVIVKNLRYSGFDTELVAFEPNQIKLADGSNTTFDPENPDIRYERGGETSSPNIKFMKWYVDWYKSANKDVHVSISIPNEFSSPTKDGKGKIVILDLIEKKGDADAKKYMNEILQKADELGVSIYLQPIPRTHNLKSEEHKNKITKDYLTKYYEKFGFENTNGGFMVREPKMDSDGMTYHLGGYMSKHLAPNGKPSNLTHEQWHLVRTLEFKAWFGDWENDPENASKVVDENGEPLVVYHGSPKKFTIFKGGLYWFTNQPKISKRYGNKIYACFLNVRKPFEITPLSGYEFKKDKEDEGGYYYNLPTNINWVVKNTTQIKLADGSNTTFDPENPDIRYERGGEIDQMIEDGIVDLKMYDTTKEHSKLYGFDAQKPLYIHSLVVEKEHRMNGVGSRVMQYIIDYAERNGNDVIFGHITQKAEPSIDVIKSMLRKSGFETINGNNDFYKLMNKENDLPVGKLAKGMTLSDIAKRHGLRSQDLVKQLFMGIETEKEHTDDVEIARAIALDHLFEDPHYYTKLKKMEISYKDGGEINPDDPKFKNTMIHKSGSAGGVLVGKRHSEGGIKAVNKSSNQPLEMEGGEVVITRNAVSDTKKREFEGKMMTNKEILSKINSDAGGVAFESGGEVTKLKYGEMLENMPKQSNVFKFGGSVIEDKQPMRIYNISIPSYLTYKNHLKRKMAATKSGYIQYLDKNFQVNFEELPYEIQVALLIGNQRLIDKTLNK